MPADAPRVALISKDGETVRLESVRRPSVSEIGTDAPLNEVGTPNWITGRAGMMYRDLLPDRLGGDVIASHIRILEGGEVPDSVHYHKIDFQLIFCLKGAIRVVYEDQGEPFWLKPGDCVLQPPEIRHRVLEAEAGSEVIEITSPAEHETWFDPNMMLPTAEKRPNRDFGGQRFVRFIAPDTGYCGRRDLGVKAATGERHDAYVERIRPETDYSPITASYHGEKLSFKTSDFDMLVVQLKR